MAESVIDGPADIPPGVAPADSDHRSPVRARTPDPDSLGGQLGAGLDGASAGLVINHADSSSRKMGSSIVMSSLSYRAGG